MLADAVRTGRALPANVTPDWLLEPASAFPEQREFVLAEDRRVALCTPRRAAKSESLLKKMLRAIRKLTGAIVPYVTMDRETGKRNVWDRLQAMDAERKIGLVFNHSDLVARHKPTGGQIEVTGLASAKEIGKLRGRKYPMLPVDEVQDILLSGDGFEGFIMSVVLPALGDVRGQLVLAGTPDPFRRNPFWYQATCSNHPRWAKWRRFSWPLTANTFFKDPEKWLQSVREEEGYSEDDPRYQAEYLGLWTASTTNLCIDGYDPARNDLPDTPEAFLKAHPDYFYVLGLDPAYKDASGFVVEGYSLTKRHCVIVESEAFRNMIVSKIAENTQRLVTKWKAGAVPTDEAKMGKHIAAELAQRYGLPVTEADKRDKRQRLAIMNSDLRTGRLQVLRGGGANRALVEQWQAVLWDREHQREAEGQVCDLFDAAGYAHMQCRSYFEEAEEVKIGDAGERYWERELEAAKVRQDPDAVDWAGEAEDWTRG